MRNLRVSAATLAAVIACSGHFVWAQQPQRDEIPMLGDRKALKSKLKGAEDVPMGKPKGKTATQCRIEVNLTEPTQADALMRLRDSVGSREDAFLKALLGAAAKRKGGGAKGECCLRLRDEIGCVWWCCGSQESHCQDNCSLAYCEAKR